MISPAVLAISASFLLAACSTPAPEVTRDESVGKSLSPAGEVIYNCLIERGWDVTLTWDGGVESSSETVPDAQSELFDADTQECMALVDDRIASMQPEEIAEVYASELSTRVCLIEEGYNVDVPPSEQQYIDAFHGKRWSAYGAADVPYSSLSEAEWQSLNEACPQPAWSLGVP